MVSRATHYNNKRRHDQRPFPEQKARMVKQDDTNQWMPEFVSSAQGIGSFGVNSIIALQLGQTAEDRMVKLRLLSRSQVLHMSALRVDGEFIEYRWGLTAGATLPAAALAR